MIALVDDDPALLESLGSFFAAHGVDSLGFTSADGFCLARVLDTTDCLITDICMPGMNGIDLIRHVRKSHPALPCILITGAPGRRMIPYADLGVREVFIKPFSALELLEAVRAAGVQGRAFPTYGNPW